MKKKIEEVKIDNTEMKKIVRLMNKERKEKEKKFIQEGYERLDSRPKPKKILIVSIVIGIIIIFVILYTVILFSGLSDDSIDYEKKVVVEPVTNVKTQGTSNLTSTIGNDIDMFNIDTFIFLGFMLGIGYFVIKMFTGRRLF